jgi:hypothetical protein
MKHRRKENDGRGNKSGYQIEEFCWIFRIRWRQTKMHVNDYRVRGKWGESEKNDWVSPEKKGSGERWSFTPGRQRKARKEEKRKEIKKNVGLLLQLP